IPVLRGNQVYSNPVGIQLGASGPISPVRLENNLVYANTNVGVDIRSVAVGTELINNTIYQSVGDAVLVGATSVTLRNNIFWAEGGHAITVADAAQSGFTSDYNLFHLTGGGAVARWQGRDFTSIVDWYYELGFDAHSRIADPLF